MVLEGKTTKNKWGKCYSLPLLLHFLLLPLHISLQFCHFQFLMLRFCIHQPLHVAFNFLVYVIWRFIGPLYCMVKAVGLHQKKQKKIVTNIHNYKDNVGYNCFLVTGIPSYGHYNFNLTVRNIKSSMVIFNNQLLFFI